MTQIYSIFWIIYIILHFTIVVRDSSLATGWTVRGSNSGGGEFLHNFPEWPWGPPSRLNNGYRVFLGGKAAGAWRPLPTQCRAEVKERVELYLFSTSGPSWPVLGWTLYLYFCTLQLILMEGVIILHIKFEVILTAHRRYYVEIKCQLDATDDI